MRRRVQFALRWWLTTKPGPPTSLLAKRESSGKLPRRQTGTNFCHASIIALEIFWRRQQKLRHASSSW
ncbi:uncharacterized protein Dyak_GE27694 [Drosophila yakuba]|uniref:Uncharacterized protein n=1 Tax=Drosophila yakuba TaxID=7245 RepID=A0A0R1E1A9_DROYA|nr:uncharacterized protein Dyak_GE27694 [Drosophila yakuba]